MTLRDKLLTKLAENLHVDTANDSGDMVPFPDKVGRFENGDNLLCYLDKGAGTTRRQQRGQLRQLHEANWRRRMANPKWEVIEVVRLASADTPPTSTTQGDEPGLAFAALTLALKALSQRAFVALLDLFSLITVAGVWFLWYSTLSKPTFDQPDHLVVDLRSVRARRQPDRSEEVMRPLLKFSIVAVLTTWAGLCQAQQQVRICTDATPFCAPVTSGNPLPVSASVFRLDHRFCPRCVRNADRGYEFQHYRHPPRWSGCRRL